MAPRHRKNLRALQAAGVVFMGVLAVSCTQGGPNSGSPLPTQNSQQALTNTETSTSDSSSPGTAGTSPQTRPSRTGRPHGTPSKPTTGQGGTDRCHTSMLSGSFRNSDAGAGNRWVELTLTNTSDRTCTLYGYGGMQLYGNRGSVPTLLQRNPDPGPSLIRLAPGRSASATLHWSAIPADDESATDQCQPTPTRAEIIPPDETDPLTLSWTMGPVCQAGRIENSAYHS